MYCLRWIVWLWFRSWRKRDGKPYARLKVIAKCSVSVKRGTWIDCFDGQVPEKRDSLPATEQLLDLGDFHRGQARANPTRLLWVGKERTVETFEGFFAMMGEELASQIEFVCSDMWKPYLRVISEKCAQALHILDRFHIVAKMNEALDDVRAAEARKMA